MTTRSSKDQFDANADKYATSDVHRAGPSLPVLLELARPIRSDQSLDVATGTGHTALAVDPSHFMQRTVDQWREEVTKARWRWVEERIVPYRLEFDWWVATAGCAEAAVTALIEHAGTAPAPVRDLLNLEFDASGRVIAFHEPMLVVRLEQDTDD